METKHMGNLRKVFLNTAIGAIGLVAATLPATAASVMIHLKSTNSYEPRSQQVKAGDEVTWMNDGGTHTVTPDDGQTDPFPGSPTLTTGKTY
jgi:plastocyanin